MTVKWQEISFWGCISETVTHRKFILSGDSGWGTGVLYLGVISYLTFDLASVLDLLNCVRAVSWKPYSARNSSLARNVGNQA